VGESTWWLAALGLACWLIGFAFETIGDAQLARFKADPRSTGQVMDRGLWRYTRHPNYFGDFMVWWGHFGLALALGAPWWTLLSPAIMSFLLMKVSGVPMLERGMSERRPGYAEYVRRTSAFFPRRPR
jgi:steroid 5-alpha reductase family enzyme